MLAKMLISFLAAAVVPFVKATPFSELRGSELTLLTEVETVTYACNYELLCKYDSELSFFER